MSVRTDLRELRGFAQSIMEVWPDGDVEGGDLQELAIRHGLLALVDPPPSKPCKKGCWCEEYYSTHEWQTGEVICYRRTPLLTGEEDA